MPHLKHILAHPKHIRINTPEEKIASGQLFAVAQEGIEKTLKKLNSHEISGLTSAEVKKRQHFYGKNEIIKEKSKPWWLMLLNELKDPLSLLLAGLAIISFLTKDYKATVMIGVMLVLSIGIRFFQEAKADKALKKLQAMVKITAEVIRNRKRLTVPFSSLVPGDIVHLDAGDMIPADLILISSKDLYVNQAALSGESLPAEKHAETQKNTENLLDLENICFLGTNVESGSATGLIVSTGDNTYLGSIAKTLNQDETATNFDLGLKNFTLLIIKFILIMVPIIFLINFFNKGNWFEAFLFATAVAVGLAPEMLPMIVTVNLSKGATDMSRKKVIVKHLNSIQNFGAMDILCTDKTGTLTEGKVVLEKFLDMEGQDNLKVLEYAYLNSYFQTGLSNLLDVAVLKHQEVKKDLNLKKFKKIDEIPFDFVRRRMSVILKDENDGQTLVCKGAVEELFSICKYGRVGDKILPLNKIKNDFITKMRDDLNKEGFRVMAVAYKKIEQEKSRYGVSDENELILDGFLAFLDPPKPSAETALKAINQYGIQVKVLTGDNELVTEKVCSEVGIKEQKIVLGNEIDKLNEEELKQIVKTANIFAKLTPIHKERIVKALRQDNHVVGFMGDGINDAPALRAADVGISVNDAADIAKESSDIIMLEKNLQVLQDGVIEGRKIFGNITKYMQMAASSNFGNMFSVVGASIFLPFLPMLPIQILVNNLLYDFSQTAIPTDKVDEEFLLTPRQWDIGKIKKFILLIGPISSLFDYATYFAMLFIFNAWINPALFQTGWFIESLISQTLIIYIIRTKKIPIIQSRPSWPLTFTTLIVCAIAIYLPFSPLASSLGFTPLPPLYWLILLLFIFAYFIITQIAKSLFNKKYHIY